MQEISLKNDVMAVTNVLAFLNANMLESSQSCSGRAVENCPAFKNCCNLDF